MVQIQQGEERPRNGSAATDKLTGRYVYCVARAGEAVSLGEGIEGRNVYTIMHDDICALVHDCPPIPYQSGDPEIDGARVLAHHQVVDTAWKRWGTVLPLTFNTIVVAQEEGAEESLKAWLERDYESLKGRLDALIGMAEYGVQVSWDAAIIARKVVERNPEARKLEHEIEARSRGIAYMYRQKLESLLKKEMEARASAEFKQLYDRLSRCADKIHVEKNKEAEGTRQMLMNLSCLVPFERYPELKRELDKVSNAEGFFVRIAGPLPPYSFC